MAIVKCPLTLIVAEIVMRQLGYWFTAAPLRAGIVLGVLAVVLLNGCTRDEGASASSLQAATPEAAIGAFVQANAEQYAGLCEQTRSPQDVGKVCSKLIDQRGSVQAHLIGRTFSEFATWVFVAPEASGWTVVGTEELDFFDTTGAIPWPD